MRSGALLLLLPLVAALAGATPVAAQVGNLIVEPYLQSPGPTSMVVGWETAAGNGSEVEYGLDAALGQAATGSSIASGGGAFIHHVELTGLTPDTRYYYRVITGTTVSATHFFRTPPPLTEELPFHFIGGPPRCHDWRSDAGTSIF